MYYNAFSLVFVLLILNIPLSFGVFYDYHHAVDIAAYTVSSRIKKQANCYDNCASTMMFNMLLKTPEIKYLAEHMQDSPLSSMAKLSQTEFKTYCQDVMLPFFYCMDECESSLQKDIMLKALKTLKVLCVDRFQDIYEHFDCLDQAERKIKQTCFANCPSIVEAVKNLTEFRTTKSKDAKRFERVMGDYCDAVDCSIPCMKKTTTETCGDKISKIVTTDLIGTAMKSLKDVIGMTDGQIAFPRQCDKVILDSDTGGKTISALASRGLVMSLVTLLFCVQVVLRF